MVLCASNSHKCLIHFNIPLDLAVHKKEHDAACHKILTRVTTASEHFSANELPLARPEWATNSSGSGSSSGDTGTGTVGGPASMHGHHPLCNMSLGECYELCMCMRYVCWVMHDYNVSITLYRHFSPPVIAYIGDLLSLYIDEY